MIPVGNLPQPRRQHGLADTGHAQQRKGMRQSAKIFEGRKRRDRHRITLQRCIINRSRFIDASIGDEKLSHSYRVVYYVDAITVFTTISKSSDGLFVQP